MIQNRNLNEIQKELNSGKLLLVDAVKYYLDKISSQKHLNVFISVFENDALTRAEEIQKKINSGTAGKLAALEQPGNLQVLLYLLKTL